MTDWVVRLILLYRFTCQIYSFVFGHGNHNVPTLHSSRPLK